MVRALIYTTLILAAFGQLQRLSFVSGAVNIYLHEITLLVLTAVLSYRIYLKKKSLRMIVKDARYGALVRASAMFISALLVSVVWGFWHFTPLQNLFGILYVGRIVLYLWYFFVLLLYIRQNPQTLHAVRRGFIAFLVLTIFFSVTQYFLYPNLRNLYYLGWDPHQFRVFGTLFDTTLQAAVLTMSFIWALTLMRRPKIVTHALHRYATGAVLATLLALTLLTYSRAGYVALLISGIYLFWRKISITKGFLALAVIVSLIWLLPRPFGEGVKLERVFSITTRLSDQKEGFTMWSTRPLIGVGYGRIEYARLPLAEESEFISHSRQAFSSTYVTLLAGAGLVGVGAFAYFISRLWRLMGRSGRSVLLAALTVSLFDNVLFTSFVMLVLFTILPTLLSEKKITRYLKS